MDIFQDTQGTQASQDFKESNMRILIKIEHTVGRLHTLSV